MPGKTTLKKIVSVLSERCGLKSAETAEAVESLLDAMRGALQRRERIEIRGLGTFKVRFRKERWARDLRRNRKVFVPGHSSPVFIPGAKLKKALNRPG
jgi:nucleoid DNA-binding protein